MVPECLSLEETARAVGYDSPRTFQNNLRRLQQEEGFPSRLPSGKWYAPAVDAWCRRASGMEPETAPESVTDMQTRMLEDYYAKRGKAA